MNGIARQEVVHLDLAHLGVHDPPLDQLGQGGQDAVPHASFAAALDDAADHGTRRRGDGDEDLADLVPGDERWDVVDAPKHRPAADAKADLGRIVVNEADDGERGAMAALDLLEQPDAGLARTYDQRDRVYAVHDGTRPALAPEP